MLTRLLTLAAIAFSLTTATNAQVLATWDFEAGNGLNGTAGPTGIANPLPAGQGIVVASLAPTPANMNGGGSQSLSAYGWPTANTPDEFRYLEVSVLCPNGDCDLTGFSLDFGKDANGPRNVDVAYAFDDFGPFTTALSGAAVGTGFNTSSVNLPIPQTDNSEIILRVYAYNAVTTTANAIFYLDRIVIRGEQSQAPLPVEFTSVTATRTNGEVAVKWTTAGQFDVDQFLVTTSTSKGESFATSAEVAGLFADQGNLEYSANFAADAKTDAYVQVVAVDLDGSLTYSDVVVAPANGSTQDFALAGREDAVLSLSVQPNTDVAIYNQSGQLLRTYPGTAASSMTIDVSGLSGGILYLTTGTQTIEVLNTY